MWATSCVLMRGITTVRDIAGNSLGLAKGVRMGWISGPRIYSSGPPLCPLGGHFDIGGWNQDRGEDESVLMSMAALVNGRDEVTKQCRWNFRKGAAFIKVMPGGGVSTEFDPIQTHALIPIPPFMLLLPVRFVNLII